MSFTNTNLKDLLKKELSIRYGLSPSDDWLVTFLSTISRPPPLPALTSTAHFRLIQTDFTSSLAANASNALPLSVADVNTKSMLLQADIAVQVLDIIDTSTSKYSQIESIERVERGEEVRGREVIRNVPTSNEDDTGGPFNNSSMPSRVGRKGTSGPHKLLLQDVGGTKVWAFELIRLEKITIINTDSDTVEGQAQAEGIQIGCKMLLKKGIVVRRGLIMLTPSDINILGGKVEPWDRQWRTGRKTRLQQSLEMENAT